MNSGYTHSLAGGLWTRWIKGRQKLWGHREDLFSMFGSSLENNNNNNKRSRTGWDIPYLWAGLQEQLTHLLGRLGGFCQSALVLSVFSHRVRNNTGKSVSGNKFFNTIKSSFWLMVPEGESITVKKARQHVAGAGAERAHFSTHKQLVFHGTTLATNSIECNLVPELETLFNKRSPIGTLCPPLLGDLTRATLIYFWKFPLH